MKQTAVEWMVKELYTKFEMRGNGDLFDEILKQAKEVEKQQIKDAYITGAINAYSKTSIDYYKETYETTL